MKNKKFLKFGIIFLSIVLIVSVVYFGFLRQSVLTPPTTVTLSNGKVYWVAANVANSMDESWTFNYRVGQNVNDYTLQDGSVVKPQKSMSIYFSKGDSYCYYTFTEQYKTVYVTGIIPETFKYWILNNANRVANVRIRDSSGNDITVNGAQTLDNTFYDKTDGKGSVTIQSQGLLVSDSDCPPQENVAVYVNKDGYAKVVYKDQLINKINSLGYFASFGNILNYLSSSVDENTQFLNSFNNYDMSPLSGYFKGYKNLGNSILTFTADQDYFDSVVYTPPKIVTPSIYQLICPSSIGTGASEGINVKIRNLDSGSSGYVNIIPTGTNVVITPLSRNMLLSDTISVPFTITAQSLAGTGRVDVQVCSQSQFGGSKCDSSSCSFNIIENNPVICGDGVCQASETNTTCPQDCGESQIICGNGKVEYGEQCDDGNIINGDGCSSTCQIENNQCGYWIRFPKFLGGKGIPNLFCIINNWFMKFRVIFSIILGFFSGLFAFLFSKDNIVNKKDKKEKWISPTIGVVLGIAIGFLAFTYFWLSLISLLILVIIKKIIPKLK